jgi:hypothetical protein
MWHSIRKLYLFVTQIGVFEKNVSEGKRDEKIHVTGRRGRRRKQLLDGLKVKRVVELGREINRLQCVENSLWKSHANLVRQTTR